MQTFANKYYVDYLSLMNMEKTCLDCGNVIHGRADKKFCNDLCRNNYNNQLNSNSYNLIRNINNILKRNRRIMEELNPSGKTKTTTVKMVKSLKLVDMDTIDPESMKMLFRKFN